ncbi:hypothetical protein XH90_22760 [Bradyrhizobium sp. CCBAU 53338]|nr:hypothetical protein XH90_22760 [Bradyrhizobium sp. CCBAU 53338]
MGGPAAQHQAAALIASRWQTAPVSERQKSTIGLTGEHAFVLGDCSSTILLLRNIEDAPVSGRSTRQQTQSRSSQISSALSILEGAGVQAMICLNEVSVLSLDV